MKNNSGRKRDWVLGAWICQMLFFAAGGVIYFMNSAAMKLGPQGLYYMGAIMTLAALSTLTLFLFKGALREIFGIAFVIGCTFILPFSLAEFGIGLPYVGAAGVLYSMVMIALSPLRVSFLVLIFSSLFACMVHAGKLRELENPMIEKNLNALKKRMDSEGDTPFKDGAVKRFTVQTGMSLKVISGLVEVYGDTARWQWIYKANKNKIPSPEGIIPAGTSLLIPRLPGPPKGNYYAIIFSYLCGAGLAFVWKILIAKMFDLYSRGFNANIRKTQLEVSSLNNQLSTLERDYQSVKEEMAIQIIEMNKITGFKRG